VDPSGRLGIACVEAKREEPLSARKLVVPCCVLLAGMAAPVAAADVAVPIAVPESPLDGAVQDVVGATGSPPAATAEPAMVAAVNRARAARGLRALRHSRSLGRSAHRYAAWMLRSDYFGHLPAIRAGRRFRRLGEALALHYGRGSRIRRTVRTWLGSPAHRSLLLSRRFRALGTGQAAGVYRGRRATTWVLHLGA
jgi:uncharacterized protein YkwD